MIVIADYGAGNLCSVANAIARLGYQLNITSRLAEVLNARAVILLSVSAAADIITNLKRLGLVNTIRRNITERLPFFGVCLGLQILFTNTEEGDWHECLGILCGRVRRLPACLKTFIKPWFSARWMQFWQLASSIMALTQSGRSKNIWLRRGYWLEPRGGFYMPVE